MLFNIVSFVILFLAHLCECTIRVVETGKEYPSRTDRFFGVPLQPGQEFSARLQEIHGNSHLCLDKSMLQLQNWNVTPPEDGSPVALLVKKGVCSYDAKALYASKYIQPAGVVRYLIIDGDLSIPDEEDYMEEDLGSKELLTNRNSEFFEWKDGESGADYGPLEVARGLVLRRMDTVTVSLFHVNNGVAYSLFRTLQVEGSYVKREGGTRIILTVDSSSGSGSNFVIWFTICILLAFIACVCVFNSMSQLLLEASQPQHNQQPARPVQRRLTSQQVRNNIPMGVFDGENLIFVHGCKSGDRCDALTYPEPHSLEVCAVCLDEYTPGDKLRCLPCQHTFHARCIGKWLTERSSTCPLCKIDLYESEDDEEEEEHAGATQENNTLTSSWNSIPPETVNVTTPLDQPINASVQSSEERWWERGRRFGAWTRSFLTQPVQHERQGREGGAAAASDSLTTPLLDSVGPEEVMDPNSPTATENELSTSHQEQSGSSSAIANGRDQRTIDTVTESDAAV